MDSGPDGGPTRAE
jgi:alpha-soluble NSF attachment protein